ncbi:MAG: AzlC family ABC transporter permease [Acidimicrobiia bacterium]
MTDERTALLAIRRQALSVGIAVAPFGLAFGVACAQAGLGLDEAMGFSVLVFTGSAQFAAVSVLADGGTAFAAIASALLLSLRSLAYGVVMAPALHGPRWWRALVSQLMIDEAMAVGAAQPTRRLQRAGYLWGGCSVFVLWNLSTAIGAAAVSSAGDLVDTLGIDATIPAAFLALVWPRLADPVQRAVALAGAVIAVVLVPIAPAGVPILGASAAVLVARLVARLVPGRPHAERAG